MGMRSVHMAESWGRRNGGRRRCKKRNRKMTVMEIVSGCSEKDLDMCEMGTARKPAWVASRENSKESDSSARISAAGLGLEDDEDLAFDEDLESSFTLEDILGTEVEKVSLGRVNLCGVSRSCWVSD